MLTWYFLATSCANAARATAPVTMSLTVGPDRYSAPPVETWTMPSLSASAIPPRSSRRSRAAGSKSTTGTPWSRPRWSNWTRTTDPAGPWPPSVERERRVPHDASRVATGLRRGAPVQQSRPQALVAGPADQPTQREHSARVARADPFGGEVQYRLGGS